MSTPPHVRVEPTDEPRVGDLQRFPGQRRPVKRFAEMATIPWKPRFGTPTPDAGYALRLAERFEPLLELASHERADDALAAGAVLAMQRAGRAGRGPIPADVEVGLTALGYLGGVPDEVKARRGNRLAGIRSDYDLQRWLGERFGHEALELTADDLRARLGDVPDWLGLRTDAGATSERDGAVEDAAKPAEPPAHRLRRAPRLHRRASARRDRLATQRALR